MISRKICASTYSTFAAFYVNFYELKLFFEFTLIKNFSENVGLVVITQNKVPRTEENYSHDTS